MRKLGVALFVGAFMATLLGIFHLFENWRGKRKWETYQRQLIAQGVKLDFASFIPPRIPDEDNFAAGPFFAGVLPGPLPTNFWNRWPLSVDKLRPNKSAGKRNQRHLTDFMAWQTALRATNAATDRAEAAKELLAVMKVFDPALQELRAARARPHSRYDIDYDVDNTWGIRLPHLPVLKQVCQDLSLKACAELAAGNTAVAMEEVRLLARITHSLDNELFLITYLVKVACLQLLVQPIWEGLALAQWSDAQLDELQRIMLGFNFVGDLTAPLGVERAAGILTADLLMKQKKKHDFLTALTGGGGTSPFGNLLFCLAPRGWFYMEQYNCARLFQEFIWPGLDATNRIVYAHVSDRNDKELLKVLHEGNPILSHKLLAGLLLPAVGKVHRRAAEAQTAAHQAAIACALERYRRKQGDYPAELAQLAPEFIATVPHDVLGGKPMRYKTGKPIIIYSVGWDEKDDAGTPGTVLWDERGDWVWTYPVQGP